MAGIWSNEVHIYIGRFDNVSTALTSLNLELAAPALDKTGFNVEAESVQAGLRADKVTMSGWFVDGNDQDINGLIGSLIGSGVGDVISVGLGTATGDRAYVGQALTRSIKTPARTNELVRAEIELNPDTTFIPMKHFGTQSSLTGSSNTGTVDDSTGTTGTGYFATHLGRYEGTLGTVSLNLQHSANGTTWSTKETHSYTAGGSTLTTITGSLDRYVRVTSGSSTATGTYKFFAVYKRP